MFPGVTATELLYDPATATLVVGTAQGVRLVDTIDGTISPPILPDQFVQALALGPDDSVLVGTRAGCSSGSSVDRRRTIPRDRPILNRPLPELGIPGVGTATIPHLPASAVRGVASIAFDATSGTVATAGFGYARFWSVSSDHPTQLGEAALTWTVGEQPARRWPDRSRLRRVMAPNCSWPTRSTSGGSIAVTGDVVGDAPGP